MSSNSQNPSMSAVAKPSVKKSVKSSAVPVAPVVVAAPVEVVSKKGKKVESAVTVTVTPVVTAQPVAADPVAVEEKTWQEELRLVQDQLALIRDAAASALAASKRLERRAVREVKDARKNRRKQRAPLAEGEERKPSIFQIPVPISDELSVFLGGGKNNQMSRSQVTKAISVYVKENGLNDKHKINPNAALRKLLVVKEGDELTIFNMQSYLQKHYVKVEKPAV